MHPTPANDPDLLDHVLRLCLDLAPGFTETIALQIEQRARLDLGGQRVVLAKRGKRMTESERAALYSDITSSMPTQDILQKHAVSRATLYRLAKRGP
jgi:antitoxin component of MazEF toxin-antitoxin module